MKEVKLKRYAGPFNKPPFENYIQSPIGLVPKDGGRNTHLIFHLSYPRNRSKGYSINGCTPKRLCSVAYPDFNKAMQMCLAKGVSYSLGKSDMSSAFRNLGMSRKSWPWLIMLAENPLDGKTYYFVDKCMPFGASISCSHFQRFSNSVAYLVTYRTKKPLVNYLDDFLFAALMKLLWQ